VVTKPAGMDLVGGRARNAKAGVAEIVGRLLGGQRPERVWPVHDMDRDAAGLAVFARNPRAAEHLRESFKRGRVTRVYAAVVVLSAEDAPDVEATSIQTLLRPDRRGMSEVVPLGSELEGAGPGGSEGSDFAVRAVTHAQPRRREGRLAIVRFRAETDYPFQVRAHAASRSMPVLGDRGYGAPSGPTPKLYLYADELSFEHPGTRKPVRFRRPFPKAFDEVLNEGFREPEPISAGQADEPTGGSGPDRGDDGWEEVADWYAGHLASSESDHQTEVVRPGVLGLVRAAAGGADDLAGVRILDVACGEGALSRDLAAAGASVAGVDASAGLIDAAGARAGTGAIADRLSYTVGDARAVDVEAGSFDAATCVLALMNIDDVGAVFESVARALRPGGVFVGVILHPAFRSPERTAWGFAGSGSDTVQYRRVAGYLSEHSARIVMNPGAVAGGAEPIETTTHTRPIAEYVNALSASGLFIERLEEWPSHRRSNAGPRAEAENRARSEIPLFLAWTTRKVDAGASR